MAVAAVGGSAILALLLVALAGQFGARLFFGLPLDGLLAALVAPLAVLAATFVFARRQRALDRRFDVAED